jgi:hypothetical protein
MGSLISQSSQEDNKLDKLNNIQDNLVAKANELDQQLGLDGRAYYNFINSFFVS